MSQAGAAQQPPSDPRSEAATQQAGEGAQSGQRPHSEVRLDAAYRNLDRTIAWVNNADSKALIFLTFDGVVVGLLAANASAITGTFAAQRSPIWQVVIGVFAIAFVSTFSVSLLILLRALFPDTRERNHEAGSGSLFFFGTVARLSDAEYRRRWFDLNPASIESELLQQTAVNAAIVDRKFAHLKTSVRMLVLALTCLLLLTMSIVVSNM